MINIDQLVKLTGRNKEKVEPFLEHLNFTTKTFVINTPLRLAHFYTQILHESGCLRYVEEIASGDAYDTRTDLGNTPEIDGDGKLFKGRGLIQITGRDNYILVSRYFNIDFRNNPLLLKDTKWACLSAGWYWNSSKKTSLNVYADNDMFFQITKSINGGYNGLKDRLQKLINCYKVFGVDNYDNRVNDKFDYIVKNLNTKIEKRDRLIFKTWNKFTEIEAMRKESLGKTVYH
jgi:putative chitinase